MNVCILGDANDDSVAAMGGNMDSQLSGWNSDAESDTDTGKFQETVSSLLRDFRDVLSEIETKEQAHLARVAFNDLKAKLTAKAPAFIDAAQQSQEMADAGNMLSLPEQDTSRSAGAGDRLKPVRSPSKKKRRTDRRTGRRTSSGGADLVMK